MTPTETAAILRQFNEWSRGDEDIPQFDPREIGEAIDAAVEMIERLEAAESDALEQARLNGMGASREAALMAKLEAAEKDIAHIKEVEFPRKVRAVAVGWEKKCARLEQERDALRAPTEQDTSVRKAWARFSNELHRGPDAPYPGMAEGFEQHFSQAFTDRDWRAESGTWAAAWKAMKGDKP